MGSLKEELGARLEEAFPGKVIHGATVTTVHLDETDTPEAIGKKARRMAREPEADEPLPLGDTRSSRGADDRLRLYIERVESLHEDAKAIADDVKDVFTEIKSAGYDVKAVREVVRLRKMDADERRQFQGVLDTYLSALGLA